MNATQQQVQLENVEPMLFVAIHPVASLARANLGLQETHSLIVTVSFTISHDVMNIYRMSNTISRCLLSRYEILN